MSLGRCRSTMSGGYYDNVASPVQYGTFDFATGTPAAHTADPAPSESPGQDEVLGRVTLKWTPNDITTATLKASGDYNYFNNSIETQTNDMEAFVTEFLNIVARSRGTGGA